ncbi:MAG: (d)CMP kinase [Acidobacteria bacterium]|nr:(d)CMP kinase [Acidobacteriota bacterium]
MIIAIDGPVGSGKSTVARRVAELLTYTYLDSGAMYRALAWKALRDGVTLDSVSELEALARRTHIDLEVAASAPEGSGLRVRLDGADVTEAIRSAEVSQAASQVAVVPGVRRVLVAEQLHRFHRRERVQDLAQHPDAVQFCSRARKSRNPSNRTGLPAGSRQQPHPPSGYAGLPGFIRERCVFALAA